MENTVSGIDKSVPSPGGRVAGERFRRGRRGNIEGRIVRWVFFGCAIVSIFTTIAIVFSLVSQAVGFFQAVPIWDFLTGTRWTPILKPRSYGVLPLVNGTLLVAALAAIVALPIGLMTAIFLAEYAPDKAPARGQASA